MSRPPGQIPKDAKKGSQTNQQKILVPGEARTSKLGFPLYIEYSLVKVWNLVKIPRVFLF